MSTTPNPITNFLHEKLKKPTDEIKRRIARRIRDRANDLNRKKNEDPSN